MLPARWVSGLGSPTLSPGYPSFCSAAWQPRSPGRLPSSDWSCPTRPGGLSGPTMDGLVPSRSCLARHFCSVPTPSDGWSCRIRNWKQAWSPRFSARPSSSRLRAVGGGRGYDRLGGGGGGGMSGWGRVAGGTGCSADGHVPALRLSALRAGARHRAILVAGLCVAGVVGLAFTALLLGATSLPATRVVATLFGGGDPGEQLIVLGLRAPRIAAALLAGVGFAMAGATFQSLLHNPLASPDILGISGGASLGALVCLLVRGAPGPLVALGAFAGAMGVAFVIWAVAWNRGLHGIRFVLVGVGVAYLCGALVGWLIASANVRVALSEFQWTVGSVADVRGDSLGLLTVGTAVCAGWVLVRSRMLRPLVLGDDRARSLGVRANAARGDLLGAAVLT